MKIDRLIGILSVLLQQEQVTAPMLAEKFEVSRRTINRDVDTLCQAGIPLVTVQGKNGGISIMEGYKLDKTLLTSTDLKAILSGLKSLDSVSGTNRYRLLMEKLSCGDNYIPGDEHIRIDLSSWDKAGLSAKIERLHGAIERTERVSFVYCSPKEENLREIEPYQLIFRWSSWYIWGYCLKRQAFRLFKLNRMTGLSGTGQFFEKRTAPTPDLSVETLFPDTITVRAIFTPGCKWRLIEEFGIESFQEQPDKTLRFSFGFTDEEYALRWLLTFGTEVQVLAPQILCRRLYEIGSGLCRRYGTTSS